jgi:hypothetical protein
MSNNYHRVMWGFVALFFAAVIAVTIYQAVWIEPGKRCEAAHKWWDPDQRVCGTPLYLPAITHRPNKPVAPVGPGR